MKLMAHLIVRFGPLLAVPRASEQTAYEKRVRSGISAAEEGGEIDACAIYVSQ